MVIFNSKRAASLPPLVVWDFMFYYVLNPAPCQITYNIYGFRCYRSSLPQPLQCTLWQQSLFPYAVRVISCIFEFLQNILVNYYWYHLPLKHSILLHTLKCNYCTIKCVNLWLFCWLKLHIIVCIIRLTKWTEDMRMRRNYKNEYNHSRMEALEMAKRYGTSSGLIT